MGKKKEDQPARQMFLKVRAALRGDARGMSATLKEGDGR